ncbi:MAG: hypothetical protein IAE83_21615 [Anaerolinea sp.]|nr:hypothetical protein [Anaerolinea sp.]CAG1001122.1 hypothetical protein ANRL4_03154 [Anaerolineae bacterium]
MEDKTKVETLREIIQSVADERPDFFKIKGEGAGNLDTNNFIAEVRQRAKRVFGKDFSERRICGETASAVDFYFEDEATIVEIALGLGLPNSEYEKDILKALLAQETYAVERLVLVGKPGALKQCAQPGRTAIRGWAFRHHKLIVDVYEIINNHPVTQK